MDCKKIECLSLSRNFKSVRVEVQVLCKPQCCLKEKQLLLYIHAHCIY